MLNLLLAAFLASAPASIPAPEPAPCDADAAVCRCVPFTTAEAMERAVAVFTGTVISVDSADDHQSPGARFTVRMRVDAAWKGIDTEEMTVIAGSTSCDIRFEPGAHYVIFGRLAADGTLRSGMCTGTRRVEPGAEELNELGAPAHTYPRPDVI
jgi:hypothetical protein